jgi:hypothetical protein
MMRFIKPLLVAALFLPVVVFAQEKFVPLTRHPVHDSLVIVRRDTIQQIDIFDAIGSLFTKSNITPKTDSITAKPIFSVFPAVGYTLQSKFAVTLAGNIAFRLAADSKVSLININAAYTQTKQLIIPLQSSIWTHGNQYNFKGDIRFYKYPQSTYGLGTGSKIINEDPMNFTFIRFYETVLRHIAGNFYAGVGYALDAHLNVSHKGTASGLPSDYGRYGDAPNAYSSGIMLNTVIDSRDNPINPSRGGYAGLQYRYNRPFLGSTSSWTLLIIDVRKYYRFPRNSENVIAFWSYNWLILNGNPPYLDLPSNTWDPFSGTGRGYIQGRFRGAQMVYLETEYRFKLTRNGLLGGAFFVNAQSC